VAGLSYSQAQNIIRYRTQHGPFINRADVLNVPSIDLVSYQQSIGFLRIFQQPQPEERFIFKFFDTYNFYRVI